MGMVERLPQFYEYIEEAIALLDWPFNKPSNEGDKDKVE